MTKADREEFDRLMTAWRKVDHYAAMAAEHCLNYKLTTKAEILARMREKKLG